MHASPYATTKKHNRKSKTETLSVATRCHPLRLEVLEQLSQNELYTVQCSTEKCCVQEATRRFKATGECQDAMALADDTTNERKKAGEIQEAVERRDMGPTFYFFPHAVRRARGRKAGREGSRAAEKRRHKARGDRGRHMLMHGLHANAWRTHRSSTQVISISAHTHAWARLYIYIYLVWGRPPGVTNLPLTWETEGRPPDATRRTC